MNSIYKVPALRFVESGCVREDRGLLPYPDPLECFPEDFPEECHAYDELARELPARLYSGLLAPLVEALPLLPVGKLEGRYAELGFRYATFITNAYAWRFCVFDVDAPHAESIPENLARTMQALGAKLDVPPVQSYWMYAMNNFVLIDPAKPVCIENIRLLQHYTISPFDEHEFGFIAPHQEIEAEAGPGLVAIPRAQEAIVLDDRGTFIENLEKMASSLKIMTETLERIPSLCSPNWYFLHIRPWIFYFKTIRYDGVGTFTGFKGETGAQTSSIASFDRAFRVRHRDTELKSHLRALGDYRPPLQRKWLRAIERGPSIRAFVMRWRTDSEIRDSFNAANAELAEFLRVHLKTALMFIQDKGRGPIGTGGTHYQRFLSERIKEVEANMI